MPHPRDGGIWTCVPGTGRLANSVGNGTRADGCEPLKTLTYE